jgi:phenylalanine-4-hydroxylase
MYEAIRLLSIVKEAEGTPQATMMLLRKQLKTCKIIWENCLKAQIRNLHWWTVEYGLIGTVESPKIYGAGLLSSIGESAYCMTDQVTKGPMIYQRLTKF